MGGDAEKLGDGIEVRPCRVVMVDTRFDVVVRRRGAGVLRSLHGPSQRRRQRRRVEAKPRRPARLLCPGDGCGAGCRGGALSSPLEALAECWMRACREASRPR